jgi:hypothetical protein
MQALAKWFEENGDELDASIAGSIESLTTELQELMQCVPESIHSWVIDMLSWSLAQDPSFSVAKGICALIKEYDFAPAIEFACSFEQTEVPLLNAWFHSFRDRNSAEILNTENWCGLPLDCQILAVKRLGHQVEIPALLELLGSSHIEVRCWSAWHLAHLDGALNLKVEPSNNVLSVFLRRAGTPGGVAQYGEAVRAQVREVIVRQALAGAPWREICAGPMAVNGISVIEVYAEVARRTDLLVDLKYFQPRADDSTRTPLDEQEYQAMWRKVQLCVTEVLRSAHETADWRLPDESQLSLLLTHSIVHLVEPLQSQTPSNEQVQERGQSEDWRALRDSTATDRKQAESALLDWYAMWNVPPPARIEWYQNPGDALIAASKEIASSVGSEDGLRDYLRVERSERFCLTNSGIAFPGATLRRLWVPACWVAASWDALRTRGMRADFWAQRSRATIGAAMRQYAADAMANGKPNTASLTATDALANNFGVLVNTFDALANSFGGFATNEAGSRLAVVANDATSSVDPMSFVDIAGRAVFFGQFEYDWLREFQDNSLDGTNTQIWRIFERAAQHCGLLWTFKDCAIVSEKPVELHFNRQMLLHNENGPAVRYSDGCKWYFINGIAVKKFIVEEPERISIEMIEFEMNVEIRRILVDRYGQQRYLVDSGATIIHQDEAGVLYRKDVPRDEPLVMVKVINSTPEPDGSFKEYFLRVPPDLTTVRAAIAWTFDMQQDQYEPTMET